MNTRRLLIAAGIVWVAALHVVAVLAFFAPHVLPYQGWRLSLPPTEPTAYVAQRHRMLVHRDANAEPGGVVLLGASHLEGFDPALLAHPVRNYAASGDTLRNATTRVADYPNLATADAIVVQAAYNDLAHRSATEVGADMPAMLARLPAHVPVVVIGMLPTSVPERQAQAEPVNAAYRRACESVARCRYLDPTPLLGAEDGSLRADYDRGDGIHLNRAGYRRLANGLAPLLAAADAATSPARASVAPSG